MLCPVSGKVVLVDKGESKDTDDGKTVNYDIAEADKLCISLSYRFLFSVLKSRDALGFRLIASSR